MAWERRNSGQHYYYRGDRISGRVVKTYFGRDMIGTEAAELDVQQQLDAELQRAECLLAAGVDEHLDELHRLGRLLTDAALYAAGYYQHARGEWRQRDGYK